jgi:hypothetical protein
MRDTPCFVNNVFIHAQIDSGGPMISIKVKAYPFNSIVTNLNRIHLLSLRVGCFYHTSRKKKQRIPNAVISRGHTARSRANPRPSYIISISIESLGPSYESFISCTTDLGPLHFININIKTMATVIHFCFLS